MIYCQICCEPFHTFCLLPGERPEKENKENWCCRRCKFCHVCGRRSKHTKVCSIRAHEYRSLSCTVSQFSVYTFITYFCIDFNKISVLFAHTNFLRHLMFKVRHRQRKKHIFCQKYCMEFFLQATFTMFSASFNPMCLKLPMDL